MRGLRSHTSGGLKGNSTVKRTQSVKRFKVLSNMMAWVCSLYGEMCQICIIYVRICARIYTHTYIYIHWRRKKKYMDSRSALIHEFGPKRIVLMMRCDVMLCDMNAMCTPNLWQFVCPQSRAILMVKKHGLVLQWRRDAYFEI